MTAAGTVQAPPTRVTRERIDSMVRRPHNPHAAVVMIWRRSPSRAATRAAASPVTVTFSTLPRASSSTSSHCSIDAMSSAARTTSSASRNPAASGTSWPGVRMMTANGAPFTRTSSGSSTATWSSTSPPAPFTSRVTRSARTAAPLTRRPPPRRRGR